MPPASNYGSVSTSNAVSVGSRSKLNVRDSLITGFSIAFSVKEQSEARLTTNSIVNCSLAVEVTTSSDLKLRDTKISCVHVLQTFSNEKGCIILKRNQMLYNRLPAFFMDQELPASSFTHDFPPDSVVSIPYETKSYITNLYRKTKELKLSRGDFIANSCRRCRIFETSPHLNRVETDSATDDSAKFKTFKLSKLCKTVRYCSKQCQKEDWHDHKKVCKAFKEKV